MGYEYSVQNVMSHHITEEGQYIYCILELMTPPPHALGNWLTEEDECKKEQPAPYPNNEEG